jgi:Tfp pilus assembly protein PilF
MSLLLDALKKSGSARQKESNGQPTPGSSSEMTQPGMELESVPNKPMPSSPLPSTPFTSASSRSTGENLFAAKKAPARKRFQYRLGIIPSAIIIGLVLGTAGGIYVWIEIQPPKAAHRPGPSPAVAANTVPAPRTTAPLALPPESMPEEISPPKAASSALTTPLRSRSVNVNRYPASQSVTTRQTAPAAQSAAGIQIQRQLENDDIYATLTAAYQAYQKGDLGAAWQRYREVLLKDAKNRDALLGMAAIAQQQGQDDAAMQYYKHVLVLDPRDPVAHAGMSAFSTSDTAARESRLKLSLAQTPQSAALHFALGNLYTEQSRWGDAQQAYFNAFRLEPANAQFAFNLATSLDHLGQAKLAAQYYRLALQLDNSGNAGFDRVHTQQRLNQLIAP